ncbi:MAG: response regulator transcription factor [Luteolibacter sp.]
MKRKIRILIVDDHAMVRFALAEAISGESDLTLIAEAANGQEALDLYRTHLPDVVTMDFQLPGPDGAVTTESLRAEFPEARVVLLSVFEGEEDIWRAVRAGALGYVPKSAEISEVLHGIRELAAGRDYFPPAIAARLAARRRRETLSPRELQVLRAIVDGCSNKEIATLLNLSEAAVKLYISNTLAKLGVADRTQAAIQAVRRGIVHLDG